MTTEANPGVVGLGKSGAALILGAALVLGCYIVGQHLASTPDSGNEYAHFSLSNVNGQVYVIDQQKGQVWAIGQQGPEVMFEPSASGPGWAVVN